MRIALFIFLATAAVFFCGFDSWNSSASQKYTDSLNFSNRIQGSITREFHSQTNFNKTGIDLFKVRPVTGHNRVRLQYVHLNNSTDNVSRWTGAQDSSTWYFEVLLIAYNAGVADTITEDENGKGEWIPHIAFCGSLTIPQFRGENSWASYPSVLRTANGKTGPTTTRPVIEADSFLFRVREYYGANNNNQNLYWAYGMTSFNATALGAPPGYRYLHIQYCDTAFAWQDFVRFSTSSQRKAAIVYMALDLGDWYQISGTRPWSNHNRGPIAPGNEYMENDVYLYRGDRVPLYSTLSAGMSSATQSFTMNRPSGWDVTYTTRASYQPDGYLAGVNSAQILLIRAGAAGVHVDPSLKQWAFNGSINTSSDLSLSTWTITTNDDGDNDRPDTSFATGDSVIIAWFPWMKWDGTEDIWHDGFYGSQNVQDVYGSENTELFYGMYSGFISTRQCTGIDSIGGGYGTIASQNGHSTGYRCWPPGDVTCPPLVIDQGFEWWYMKQNYDAGVHPAAGTQDGYTWRGQFMTAFYTWN